MKFEFRLKQILEECGLDHRGILGRIAKETDIHVATIRRIMNNNADPQLQTIEGVCEWLVANTHISRDEVLSKLLAPSGWDLWSSLSGREVTVLLGQHPERGEHEVANPVISRRDATVLTLVMSRLSSTRVKIEYISPTDPQSKTVIERKGVSFSNILKAIGQDDSSTGHVILIGSQLANPATEMLVAAVCRCQPFDSTSRHRVPVQLIWRDKEERASCFAGSSLPKRARCKGPGIYYRLGENRPWIHCPWKTRSEDSGVVIVVRDTGAARLVFSLWGFSGWGTEALGRTIAQNADAFAPFERDNGTEFGVFVSGFKMKNHNGEIWPKEPPRVVEVPTWYCRS